MTQDVTLDMSRHQYVACRAPDGPEATLSKVCTRRAALVSSSGVVVLSSRMHVSKEVH